MEPNKLTTLIALITIVFLVMPIFMLAYFWIYTLKKKNHQKEKIQMREQFDLEITKTQHEIKEQTMQTIGADLHDNIGQLLSLTILTLKSIPLEDPLKTSLRISNSIDLLSKAISEMRQLGKLIQGEQLLALGLGKAIQQEIDWISRTESYKIFFDQDFDQKVHNLDIELFYFRILQEVLANIIKHADATEIHISLNYVKDQLILSVSDNGIGFITKPNKGTGSGLSNIQKRAKIIGGVASIQSTPGLGTTIIISTPYP